MTELFEQLLQWVSLHPVWAGLVVFLVAMAESLAIVGVIVPGVAMMFGIGALIAAGALDFWAACAWAVAGAVVGDGLSFYLGRHFQQQLRGFWPFKRHPEMLQRGEDFFGRYGGKSIVFGRFVGPVRAVIPLVAGMMGMAPGSFLAANLGSALAWAPAYLLPGMVFGASLKLASEVAFRLVILLALLVLLLWFVAWLVKRLFRLIHPHAGNWLSRLLAWSELHPRLGEIANALADPKHPEARGLALFASLLILAAGLFMIVLTGVLESPKGVGLDRTLLSAMQSLRTPWADNLMVTFSRLADTGPVLSLLFVVLAFLAWKRHWRAIGHWLAAAAFGLFASVLLKYSLQIPRPEIGISGLSPYAFPSTHVMRATVLYGFLSVLIARGISTRWRWLPYSSAGLIITCVAVSRLYLGVHWLSDVLGSLALGLTWVAALGIAYHRHADLETNWAGLATVGTAAVLLALGTQSTLRHQAEVQAYTPARPQLAISAVDWWREGWGDLPRSRADARGRGNHPLNVQYAGDPDSLATALATRSWRPAEAFAWENSLKLLSPSLGLGELPLLPQVHDGRHETLALVKYSDQDHRLVLRLWPAGVRLMPGETRLWLGNVSSQQQERMLKLFNFPLTQPDFASPYAQLMDDLDGIPHHRPPAEQDLVLVRLDAGAQAADPSEELQRGTRPRVP